MLESSRRCDSSDLRPDSRRIVRHILKCGRRLSFVHVSVYTAHVHTTFPLMRFKPRFSAVLPHRSFQSAAASTWNALPRSVRSSTSVFQFRCRLKTELFSRSYQQSCCICLCVIVTDLFCPLSLDSCHVIDCSNTN